MPRVSSTVDEKLWERAEKLTGQNQAETIRRALAYFVDAAPPSIAGAPAKPEATRSEMSPDDRKSTKKALEDERDAVREAIVVLKRKAVDPKVPAGVDAAEESSRINNMLIPDLKKRLFDVEQKLKAFKAGELKMSAPDAATVNKITALTQSVGKKTLEAQRADVIFAVGLQAASALVGGTPA